jgi:UDP-2-acetamido-2-deoxy-ribo-hexuluronate aminotransferase
MEQIKMVDLQSQYLRIKEEIDGAISQVLMSTAFIQGPQVSSFAKALGKFVGASHVIPCANGTDALQIAMMGLGLKAGDEVILPVHTYVATAEVIALLGLSPVFVDVNEETFNIDVEQVQNKITDKTRAIVPVHLYGQCADMQALLRVAQRNNLYVIEDTAQALGATYTFSDGSVKFAGTIGHVGTTSFFPSKNLGCFGDGGAIFTEDVELAEKLRMIANHGQQKKYHHDLIGVNSRLDTLQAAILEVKLKHLDDYKNRRNMVAEFYDRELAGIPGVSVPARAKNSTHVFHQYTLIVSERRDELKAFLEKQGIPTMIYYPVPLHFQKAYVQAGVGKGSFPVTERLSERVISLPIHTEMDEAQLTYIVSTIKSFFKA